MGHSIWRLEAYRGALQILRFNWPWYVGTWLIASAALLAARIVANPVKGWLITCALVGLATSAMSLLVSHWVYDRSILRRWDWIISLVGNPARAVHLHAGFDATSADLRRLLPECELEIWDIYRPDIMTERSIARARKESANKAVPVDLAHLPAQSGSIDCAFLIFSAHEIRTERERNDFFAELRRILKPGGTLLLVEHLRDLSNFIAYGPGAWHFLPRREWLRLAGESGFSIARHFKITPFVNVYSLKKGEGS